MKTFSSSSRILPNRAVHLFLRKYQADNFRYSQNNRARKCLRVESLPPTCVLLNHHVPEKGPETQ